MIKAYLTRFKQQMEADKAKKTAKPEKAAKPEK